MIRFCCVPFQIFVFVVFFSIRAGRKAVQVDVDNIYLYLQLSTELFKQCCCTLGACATTFLWVFCLVGDCA